MKTRDFNKVLKQYLLPEFPGYVNSNRGDLVAVPMNHLWRGFVFAPSADPEIFYFSVNVEPLYDGAADVLFVGIGHRLRDERNQSWEWNESKAPEIMARLLLAMKVAEKETLDRIRSPLDYAKAALAIYQETKSSNHLRQAAFSFVYAGEFAAGIPLTEQYCQHMESWRAPDEAKRWHQILGETILGLLKTDPRQGQAQLFDWERQTIQNLKLEKFPNSPGEDTRF